MDTNTSDKNETTGPMRDPKQFSDDLKHVLDYVKDLTDVKKLLEVEPSDDETPPLNGTINVEMELVFVFGTDIRIGSID